MTNISLERKLDIGETLLHVASRRNNKLVVRFLVQECGYVTQHHA